MNAILPHPVLVRRIIQRGLLPALLCCTLSAFAQPSLQADFSWDWGIVNPYALFFTDLSTVDDGQIVSWKWSFGDGAFSTEQNPYHEFSGPGVYNVCLGVVAVNAAGVTVEATKCQAVDLGALPGCDDCLFNIGYTQQGYDIQAFLIPETPLAIVPNWVNWTIDGTPTGGGWEFLHHFELPGEYTLCAEYPDFQNQLCTVCAALRVPESCVDSNLIDPGVDCIALFDPVCGCDGQTYGNSCEALFHHGITSWHKGECNPNDICNTLTVDFEAANTGGALTTWSFLSKALFPDGVGFAWNWNFGNGETSDQQNPTINFQNPGEYLVCLEVTAFSANGQICSATVCQNISVAGASCIDPTLIDPDMACPAIYAPVCGCDGVTYENDCVAKYGFGVTSWTPGPCGNTCTDPSWIDSSYACPEIYAPVCGCDGITYGNACEALRYGGVTSWTVGACCTGGDCSDLLVNFNWWYPILDIPSMIQFNDLSSFPGGQITTYLWTFGDGGTSTESSPQHFFNTPGIYTVCLKVTGLGSDGQLCEQEFCQTITIGPDCTDACFFTIKYVVSGTALHAWLESNPVDPQYPDPVEWTLDGELLGISPQINTIFDGPGKHVLCATYAGLDGNSCTACQAIEITALCYDATLIDPNVACLAIYEPVCGCDGVTYGNNCEAYYHHGITSWTPGECGSVCNALFAGFNAFNSGGSLTVWTFDGIATFPDGVITNWYWSFGNGEFATGQSVTTNFQISGEYTVCLTVTAVTANGVLCQHTICKTIFVPSQLCIDPSIIDLNVACPAIYAPVCGCDGITYENDCVAQYHHGVTFWTPGPCQSDCFNLAWLNPDIACPAIYDPVCGCDEVTYENACVALYHHGITSWKKGPCCPQQPCKAFFKVEQTGPLTVRIIDQSVQAESWELKMGDGFVHFGGFDTLYYTYSAPGQYHICLSISNFAGDCSDTWCQSMYVSSSGESSPINKQPEVHLAPNPASESVQVQVLDTDIFTATLLDLYGRIVWEQTNPSSVFTIPMNTFSPGVYIVRVETGNGIGLKKLVKGE